MALLFVYGTLMAGELYQVQPEQLRLLDDFEEPPHVYRRTPVALAGGQPAAAYLLARPPAAPRPIAGGDWRLR